MAKVANNTIPTAFDIKAWREIFILSILRFASVTGIVVIIGSFSTATPLDRFLFIGFYLVVVAITVLPVPYALRAYVFLLILFAVGVNSIIAWGPWLDGSIFLLTSIAMASLILDNRIDVIGLILSIIFLIALAVLNQLGSFEPIAEQSPVTKGVDWIGYIAKYVASGIITVIAINQFKGAFTRVSDQMQIAYEALKVEQVKLEDKVRERTEELETRMTQLRNSATTARVVAEAREIGELMDTAVSLMSERFGYYHIGLYVLDEPGKSAYLQASASETGKSLIGQILRLEADRRNPITSAVLNNRPIISSDSDTATTFVKDPNFPLTRSRMVLPLAVRSLVIGFLDLHSDQTKAFSPEDAEILQTLADLTAISFDNVRLLDETRYLLKQLETNTSIQTQMTWSKLTTRHKPAYQYTPAGVRPIFSHDKRSSEEGLKIPIQLHGQAIGFIKLRRKGLVTTWSEREQVLVEKIAVQVGLALENSRLVDEAQKNALRNQMIANFSSSVRETLDIEAVIRTATTELRNVFDLKEAEIVISAASSNLNEQASASQRNS